MCWYVRVCVSVGMYVCVCLMNLGVKRELGGRERKSDRRGGGNFNANNIYREFGR